MSKKMKLSISEAVMAESLSKLEGSLECPVCYKIPRDVPIPCCEAGHIVCQDCRKKVTSCPTCRGRLQSSTNSVAASQVLIVDHKCKFSFFGCDVKMKLEDIVNHEKICQERTVRCPYSNCKEEIQLKKFNLHVVEKDCAMVVVRSFSWKSNTILTNRDTLWALQSFHAQYRLFYLEKFFLAAKKSFIFGVFLPEDVETSSKYSARITISPGSPRSLIYQGPVLSIEDLPDKSSSQACDKYWIVSYDDLNPFFKTGNSVQFEVEVLTAS